ncbi:DUF3710 domain-containing protein [Streptomyces sp. NRRL B-24720]|uniref:DUF3710 domain-containing protein n=1 Tax=Streptomyces sp. NRRL B-24720 TaxID=1476876 RepID=UPI00068E3AF1|nr:DUF3710 domain-containing protein [Streptomyces sp. NRRL B-24720]
MASVAQQVGDHIGGGTQVSDPVTAVAVAVTVGIDAFSTKGSRGRPMNQVRVSAKEIVEQYGRDGRLSGESFALAEFGVWNRTTPGMLLLGTGYLAALEDPALVERTLESGNEALAMMLKDDDLFGALALTDAGAELSWDQWMAWIWTYWQSRGMSPGVLDELFEEAEEGWTEIVDSGDLTRPRFRNGGCGPWDASETPVPADTERIDYGVMKIPRLEGAETRPVYAGERIVGVIVRFGGHAFSVQVYRARGGPVWDTVRPEIINGVRGQGGSAEDAESSFGVEVRAQIPVVKDGQRMLQPTRIVGCDGPGWLLRGAYGGPAALADVVDLRAHHLFTQTVVDLSAAEVQADATQEITNVEVRWPTTE